MSDESVRSPPRRNDRHNQDYWQKETGSRFRGQLRDHDPPRNGRFNTQATVRYHDLPLQRFTDELVIQSPTTNRAPIGRRAILDAPLIKFCEEQQAIPSLLSTPIIVPKNLPATNFQITNMVR